MEAFFLMESENNMKKKKTTLVKVDHWSNFCICWVARLGFSSGYRNDDRNVYTDCVRVIY